MGAETPPALTPHGAVPLGSLLGLPATGTVPALRPAMVIERDGLEIAVTVDRILEARDAVVKPLSGLLRDVPGVLGATVSGDGSVRVVLDLPNLLRQSDSRPALSPATRRRSPSARSAQLEVMIVDDSVGSRRLLSGGRGEPGLEAANRS